MVRRLLCLVPGVFCLIAVNQILMLGGSGSSVRMIAMAILGAGVLVSLIAAAFPQQVRGRVAAVVSWLLAEPSDENVSFSNRTGGVLIALGCVWLVMNWQDFAAWNRTAAGDDEVAYLEVARQIADSGGTIVLLGDLFGGEFAEANRNPLYLWLLSLDPELESGKRVSLAVTLAFFVVIVAQTTRHDGWLCGGCVAVLVGTNGALGRLGAMVGCEPLLVLMMGLFWWHVTRCVRSGGFDTASARRATYGNAAVCGVLLALLWVTKGTGLVFTGAFGVWFLLTLPGRTHAATVEASRTTDDELPTSGRDSIPTAWRDRGRILHNIRLLCLTACVWIVVALPLLVRNSVRYEDPFFNVNSWLMFTDAYTDPAILAEQQTIDEVAAKYLASHTTSDMVRREASGLVWETFIATRMLGPAHLNEGRVLPGLLLALLICLGFVLSAPKERWLIALFLALSLPLFAWYVPVAAGERFPVPLIGPLLLLGSRGLVQLSSAVGRQLRLPSALVATGILLIWLLARFAA